MDLTSTTADKTRADLGLIADTRGLNKLRALGTGDKKDQAQALYMAAQQFESLLMQYWVDGMRSTNDELNPDSPLHSKYSSFFDDMLSQQQVGAMVKGNGTGIGGINRGSITYMITKQFAGSLGDEGKALMAELEGRTLNETGKDTLPMGSLEQEREHFFALRPDERLKNIPTPAQILAQAKHESIEGVEESQNLVTGLKNIYASLPDPSTMRSFASPEEFVDKMMPYAMKAVEGVAMNPLVLVAQAALETGWGRHVPDNNNYFGIKAGSQWQGPVQKLASPEFEGGRMVTQTSSFRAYPSVLESMKDYVALINGNERYAKAAETSFNPEQYFEEIQKAGYATDPQYALKLKNISRQIAFMAHK